MKKASKTYLSLISFWVMCLLCGCVNAKGNGEKNPVEHIKKNVEQYMSDVFGQKAPTLKQFIKYQGLHGEEEYELELEFCKRKWGDSKLDIKEYAEKLPRECSTWISNRYKKSNSISSLYYESIRDKVGEFPVVYQISSIIESEMGKTIIIKILNSKCDSFSLLYTSEKYRNLGYIVLQEINGVSIDCFFQ